MMKEIIYKKVSFLQSCMFVTTSINDIEVREGIWSCILTFTDIVLTLTINKCVQEWGLLTFIAEMKS